MQRFYRYSFFILLLLCSCTEGDQETTTEVNADPDSAITSDTRDSIRVPEDKPAERPPLRFICRDIGEGMDNPLFEVSLLVGDSYYTLDTIHTCNSINPPAYADYEIPEQALSACGGWWKNAGDYFYAYEDAGDIVVMHAWQTEEQSTQGYFYKQQRTIRLPSITETTVPGEI